MRGTASHRSGLRLGSGRAIPVCAWCPTPVEGLSTHAADSASHGICRPCLSERLSAPLRIARSTTREHRSALG